MVVDQPITDPISGPSFDFTFTFGPELDNMMWMTGTSPNSDMEFWSGYDSGVLDSVLLEHGHGDPLEVIC